jgi:hypothetical protein
MKQQILKFILRTLDEFLFQFDRVIGYIMTNPRMLPYYHRRMYEKYGTRYCTKEQFEKYWSNCQD